MSKETNHLRTVQSISLLIFWLITNGCSPQSGNTINENKQSQDKSIAKVDSETIVQQHWAELHDAMLECLKRKGFTGNIRGISIVATKSSPQKPFASLDRYGSRRIVVAETLPPFENNPLHYFVVYDLEDKNGKKYPYAEFLSNKNAALMGIFSEQNPSSEKKD